MPFSEKIKEKALVASARHCCICRQFKGVKIEIHHIIPEGKGGSNTFDNAIVLCFDCHADVGHYNAEHPKGKKYSSEELRKHRDAWYNIVKENNIARDEKNDLIHCQYYATKEPSLIKEITQGDFSRFPIKNILMHNNAILEFQRKIINNFELEPIIFDTGDDGAEKRYLLEYSDIKKVDSRNSPYYSYVRNPSKEEVSKICKNMEACRFLLSTGESINNFFKALAFFEFCGGTFQERLQIRSIWACFLCITNISNKYIRIKSIKYKGTLAENTWDIFPSLEKMAGEEISLPELKIEPNSAIAIPILTLLAPFDNNNIEEISSSHKALDNIEVIEATHAKITEKDDISKFNVMGPNIIPMQVCLKYNDLDIEEDIHQFDFSNMYIYDRDFMCGCCPHIFFLKDNKLEYYGEILTAKSNEIQSFQIQAPENSNIFVISELEYEKTFIQDLKINREIVLHNKILNKGESININIKQGDLIEILGFYYTNNNSIKRISPMKKNSLIKNYISGVN